MSKISKSVKKDITRRYNEIDKAIADEEDNVGKQICFVCTKCKQAVKTEVKDKGIIPRGIICPYCGEESFHTENDVMKEFKPTFEWVRPTLEEVLELHDQPVRCNFILGGGLVRKEVRNDA